LVGQSFSELLGDRHDISANAGKAKPRKLVWFGCVEGPQIMTSEPDMASLVGATVSAMREATRQILKADRAITDDQINELERAYLILADALELKRLENEAARS
jgi:hypothetical protein